MMKVLRKFTLVLGVAVLAAGAFPAASALAHGGTTHMTAQQAGAANTEDAVREYVYQARLHILEEIRKFGVNGISEFFRLLRHPGDWNDASTSTYLIAARTNGPVRSHGKFTRSLYGTNMSKLPALMGFFENVPAADAQPVCTQYERNGTKRWTCATSFKAALGGSFVLIGGFDHDENDPGIIRPVCPPHDPPAITAAQLDKNPNREDLKKFVQEAIRLIDDSFKKGNDPWATVDCIYQDETWKAGQIYLYIMASSTRVLVNGNNPEFAGSPFRDIFDEDGVDIGKEILSHATAPGEGGYVEYKWDNPAIEGDEVDLPDKSPGTSRKIAYVEAAKLDGFDPKDLFIFGSGYYPMPEVDTGCAVAGAGADSAGSAFGLFLAVFSICFVLCARSRERK